MENISKQVILLYRVEVIILLELRKLTFQLFTGKVGTFRATEGDFLDAEGTFYRTSTGKRNGTWNEWRSAVSAGFQASRAWTGTTNTAQPQTISLGDGAPLNIQPSYITLKFWKRTS